uniref:FAD-binding PCMH-type domain-containing protein n=1 Tax=Romanomermis culicivorax TaxID=13658 RepID=A0A915ILK4_ROMCU
MWPGKSEFVENFRFKNWAGTYTCNPEFYFRPENEAEISEILSEAKKRRKIVRVVGRGYSPSNLCCTTDFMISTEKMNRIIEVDEQNFTVKVEGGIVVSDLIDELERYDMAMDVLPSLSHFSLAGMISTASHNTGSKHHVTTDYVLELEILTADGQLITCSKTQNADVFYAAAAGLGAFGVILRLKLQCTKLYALKVSNFCLDFNEGIENLELISRESMYARIFYIPLISRLIIQHVDKISAEKLPKKAGLWSKFYNFIKNELIGYHLFEFLMYLSVKFDNKFLKIINEFYFRLFYDGEWTKIDTYKNVFTVEVKIKQYAMEYAIPINKAPNAMKKLHKILLTNRKRFPAHFPCEIRFVESDGFFLSPAYGRNSAYLNILAFRPYGREPPHRLEYWSFFEEVMRQADGRPHLAKDHGWSKGDMRQNFPKFELFCQIRRKMDPEGRFMNDYIKRICE